MNKIKKKFSNIFLSSIIAKIILVLISLLNTVLINRFLGAYLRGEYAYIINLANIFQLIMNLGIGYSYTYFKKNSCYDILKSFSLIIYLQFFSYILLYLVAMNFITDESVKYIALLSIILTLDIQIQFITMVENLKKRNNVIIEISVIYTIALVIAFVFLKKNLSIILNITILRYFMECVALIYTFNLYKLDIKKYKSYIDFKLVKQVIYVGFPTMIMTLLITFNYNIDVVIMKHYLPNNEVGLYGVGVTLANMLWIIPDAFKEVFFGKSAHEDCISEVVVSIFINSLIVIIIVIGFSIFGNLFIKILYGTEFIRSYNVSIILFIGTIPMLFYKLIHPLYISNGKQNIVTKILLISVVLNVILNIKLIPSYGINGAAFASVLSYTICGVIFAARFKNDYKIQYSIILRDYIMKIHGRYKS